MSVIIQLAIFPTDKGSSVSEYVSKAIEAIINTGVSFQLTSMSTIIETETLDEGLAIVALANQAIEPFTDRIYITMTIDIRKGKSNRMQSKVDAINSIIGKQNQ